MVVGHSKCLKPPTSYMLKYLFNYRKQMGFRVPFLTSSQPTPSRPTSCGSEPQSKKTNSVVCIQKKLLCSKVLHRLVASAVHRLRGRRRGHSRRGGRHPALAVNSGPRLSGGFMSLHIAQMWPWWNVMWRPSSCSLQMIKFEASDFKSVSDKPIQQLFCSSCYRPTPWSFLKRAARPRQFTVFAVAVCHWLSASLPRMSGGSCRIIAAWLSNSGTW